MTATTMTVASPPGCLEISAAVSLWTGSFSSVSYRRAGPCQLDIGTKKKNGE